MTVLLKHNAPLEPLAHTIRRLKRGNRIESIAYEQNRMAGLDAEVSFVALLGLEAPLRTRGCAHGRSISEPGTGLVELAFEFRADLADVLGSAEFVAAFDAQGGLDDIDLERITGGSTAKRSERCRVFVKDGY